MQRPNAGKGSTEHAWDDLAAKINELIQYFPGVAQFLYNVLELAPKIYTKEVCRLVQPSLQSLSTALNGLIAGLALAPAVPAAAASGRVHFTVPDSLWQAWSGARGTEGARSLRFQPFVATLRDLVKSCSHPIYQVVKFYKFMEKDWLPLKPLSFNRPRVSKANNSQDNEQNEFWFNFSGVFNMPLRTGMLLGAVLDAGRVLRARLETDTSPADVIRAVDDVVLHVGSLHDDFAKVVDVADAPCLFEEMELPRVGKACKLQMRTGRCANAAVGLSTADLHVVCPAVKIRTEEQWKSAGNTAVNGGTLSPSPFARAGLRAGRKARPTSRSRVRPKVRPNVGPNVGRRLRSTAHRLAVHPLTAPPANKENGARKGRRVSARAALEMPAQLASAVGITAPSRAGGRTKSRKKQARARSATGAARARPRERPSARSRSHARANAPPGTQVVLKPRVVDAQNRR